MSGKQAAAAALEEALQASRKERNATLAQQMLGHDPKKLAQEMLGKSRRQQTPASLSPVTPLSSRAGITKRSASLPRPSSTSQPRFSRQASNLSRPLVGSDDYRFGASFPAPASSEPHSDGKINGHVGRVVSNGAAPDLIIRGAAATGPTVIRAQNFAPGTTAADIESVMSSIGGETTFCKLVAAAPTVIAEMGFTERSGAEKVIEMFNNKKADGRLLHVYFADGTMPSQPANGPPEPAREDLLPIVVDTTGDETIMEVDENAKSREVENKLREERRGGPSNDKHRRPADDFPRGPRYDRRYDGDYRGPPRAQAEYQDGRYGFASTDGRADRFGGGGGGGGGYRDDRRLYRGGQNYRP